MENQASDDRCLAELMRLAQDGDRAAYAQLLRRIIPFLRVAVRRRYRFLQPHDVDDFLQNILMAIHRVRATYDPERPFMPWLMAIARNQIADSARRYARRAANEVTVAEYPETFAGEETNRLGEDYGDPEGLRAAIAGLPQGQRDAIEMLKLREMTLKEAAAASGMTVGALKIATYRATRALRLALKVRDDGGY